MKLKIPFMTNRDVLIFILIYLVVLTGMLWYNFTHVLVNDGVYEYRAYLLNIEQGWQFRLNLVNSCIVTTLIPALIQKVAGLDAMILFRAFPPLFYALMPAFVYLIARRYTCVKYSLMAVLVVVLSSRILFFPDVGRVGVAMAFMTGLLWALLGKRLIWSIVFAVLVVFSYYGTSLIITGIIGVAFVAPLFKKQMLKQYMIVFCILISLTGIWHFGIAGFSGNIMVQTLLQTNRGGALPQNPDVPDITTRESAMHDVLDITTRESAVQSAIGQNLSSAPEIIEVIGNWLVVGLITLGLYRVVRGKIDGQFKIMAMAFWGLIVFTVALPWLSVSYGVVRVYFMSLSLLATCFPLGAEKIAKLIHIHPLILMGVVLVLYGLSTSGLIYIPFGMEKTFPVVANLP